MKQCIYKYIYTVYIYTIYSTIQYYNTRFKKKKKETSEQTRTLGGPVGLREKFYLSTTFESTETVSTVAFILHVLIFTSFSCAWYLRSTNHKTGVKPATQDFKARTQSGLISSLVYSSAYPHQ